MFLYKRIALLLFVLSVSIFSSGENNTLLLGNKINTSLRIDLYGGAFIDFRLDSQSVNPFSWNIPIGEMPVNNQGGAVFQGHFLCLGRWGAPTEGEIKAGVPHNGQSGNQLWNIVEQSGDSFLHICSEAPLDGIHAERKICFDAENAVFKVTDFVRSTLFTGRLFNIVQHGTIGAPFLTSETIVDTNAGKGFMQHLSYPDPHIYEYTWPEAIIDSVGTTIDLTRTDIPYNYVSTHLFAGKIGWITASSPDRGLLIGYIWDTDEYPWLNVWHEMKDGKPYAKGLEFGTTGIGYPYQELLRFDTRFYGENSFFYLDALECFEKSFICFQVRIPEDYKGVENIELKNGKIILIEKNISNSRRITIHNKFHRQS